MLPHKQMKRATDARESQAAAAPATMEEAVNERASERETLIDPISAVTRAPGSAQELRATISCDAAPALVSGVKLAVRV